MGNGTLQIDFSVFSNCNNNCSFCYQKEQCIPLFSVSALKRRFENLKDFIFRRHSDFDGVSILMMGGEMFFAPGISKHYVQFFKDLSDLSDKISKSVSVEIMTNLLYPHIDELLEVIGCFGNGVTLDTVGTSYDISGRFDTREKLDIHNQNLTRLIDFVDGKKINVAVTSVACKRSLQIFLGRCGDVTDMEKNALNQYGSYYEKFGEIEFVTFHFEDFSIYDIDRNFQAKKGFLPDAALLYDFYRKCVDEYPLIAKNIFYKRNYRNRPNCNGNCYAYKGNDIARLCHTVRPNELQVQDGLSRLNANCEECLRCKYYDVCPIRECPCKEHIVIRNGADGCFRRKIYEYMESKQIAY